MKNLTELKASLEQDCKNFKALKKAYRISKGYITACSPESSVADSDGDDDGDMSPQEMQDTMSRMISSVYDAIYRTRQDMYSYMDAHSVGHLPALKSVSQMEAALKALKMDGDYNVVKPNIYASTGKRGVVINASFPAECKKPAK